MNKSERFKSLLEKGYLPAELPPPFVTKTLAKYRNSISSEWMALGQPPKTRPEIYSYPRLSLRRRQLSIINPISQLNLTKAISENWVAIKRYISSSKISLDSPIIHNEFDRAIPKPDFNLINLKRIEAEARFEHILVSDISRFYGTIYTHTLPWALHGKTYCKTNLNNSAIMNSLIGNSLDVLVRKGQDNQTIGIPIGPDTSRILAEIIAVGVEEEFMKISNLSPDRIFRYVDDWFLGFDKKAEAEDAISFLSKACSEYELELNETKTLIIDPIEPIDELWPSEIAEHIFRLLPTHQAKDIRQFFNKVFHYASEKPSQNVLDFALKRVRSVKIDSKNIALFENYIIRAARVNPVSFPIAAQILINLKYQNHSLSTDLIAKLIFDTISKNSLVGKHGEIAWALFLAKGLGIKIPSKIIKPILNLESSVCALLTLDLKQLGLIVGQINTNFWQSFMNDDGLTSNMWLLAYEADFKGWLPSPHNHVTNNQFFEPLKRKGVYFYDTTKNVPTFQRAIKSQKLEIARRAKNMSIWNIILSKGVSSL